MNVNFQKHGPPIAVLGIALYLGWPPAPPLDLGEDVVRAKSVRWKVGELEAPLLPQTTNQDPFAAVLIDFDTTQSTATGPSIESVAEEPIGPTENDLKSGLVLGGIAQTDQHRWAIVNNRVCRKGDHVPVVGLNDVLAELRDIQSDRITVVVGKLTVKILQEDRRKKQRKSPVATPEASNPSEPLELTDDEKDDDEDPSNSSKDREWSGEDPREEFFQSRSESASKSYLLGWGNRFHSHVAQQLCQMQHSQEVRKITR